MSEAKLSLSTTDVAEALMHSYEEINDCLSRHKDYLQTLSEVSLLSPEATLSLAMRASRSVHIPVGSWQPGMPLGQSLPPEVVAETMRRSKFALYNKQMEALARQQGSGSLFSHVERSSLSDIKKRTSDIAIHSDATHLTKLSVLIRDALHTSRVGPIAAAGAQLEQQEQSQQREGDEEEAEGDSGDMDVSEVMLPVMESKARHTNISFFNFDEEDDEGGEDEEDMAND
jgi:hypothetical protein